jgi:predicted NAD/FAD-dependent oxidoreductase
LTYSEIAIVGAGIAGLSAAARLTEAGRDVRLFDKGRGPGGRLATRRAEVRGEMLFFDHGTQYFTLSNPAFAEQVEQWQSAGVAAPWPAAEEGAWTGVPAMNSVLRHEAANLNIDWAKRVTRCAKVAGGWQLTVGEDVHECAVLLLAIPAEQAAELLEEAAPSLAAQAAAVRSAPCWAVMAAFDEHLAAADCLRGAGAIRWAARGNAKPGRAPTSADCWVIHAGRDWSQEHLEWEAEAAGEQLLAEFFDASGAVPAQPVHLAAHRWRFAFPEVGKTPLTIWDGTQKLGVAGDWLAGPRVEDAWLSGKEAAARILA